MTNYNYKKSNHKVLAVIPARGGSKGIPKKNLHNLAGKPLIYYSLSACQKSKLITDIIVTTDNLDIKKTVESYGLEVPFLRPERLATDDALAIPTVIHSVKKMEKLKNKEYDYVIMIQPTAPLRTAKDIDDSLELLFTEDTDSIISIVDVDNYHPIKMKVINKNRLLDFQDSDLENPPRQSLPKVYIVNGAIYATKRNVLIENETFKGESCFPFVMPQERSVNIDNISDFIVAEYYLSLDEKN